MDKKKLIWIGVYVVAAYLIYGYFKKKPLANKQAISPSQESVVTPETNAKNKDIISSFSDEQKTEFTNQLISQYLNKGLKFTDGMTLKTNFGDFTKKDGVLVKL